MTITWLPSQEEIVRRLRILDRAEDALAASGIGGIYDDFDSLADAIEQMATYIKEIERERDEWNDRAESAKTELVRVTIQRSLARHAAEGAEAELKQCYRECSSWRGRAEAARAALREVEAEREREHLAWKDWGTDVNFGAPPYVESSLDDKQRLRQCDLERSAWKHWAKRAEAALKEIEFLGGRCPMCRRASNHAEGCIIGDTLREYG